MELDNGSLMFNMKTEKPGNTAAWGTALGQSKKSEYRFTKDDYSEIIVSMVYKKINDMENFKLKLGKPGADQDNYAIVLASMFEKIYVNDILIEGAKFILAISQELTGEHEGRRFLKYNPKISYKDFSNEDGYEMIRKKFGIKPEGAWFITDIYTMNQDELHFNAYFPKPEGPMEFEDEKKRKEFMTKFAEEHSIYKKEHDYTEDELANMLKNIRKIDSSALAIHLFGIKHWKTIETNGYSKKNIIEKAGINVSTGLETELAKGIKIGKNLGKLLEDDKNSVAFEKGRFITGLKSEYARNRIIFGAPGTGKSHTLNEECERLLKDGNENNYERVTFHPDYTYANFVGTYKPVAYVNEEGKNEITYKYVPGPFLRVYVEALKSIQYGNPKPYVLVIEEINRANAAAVFGDIFQLLDRNSDNISEYPIETTEDMRKYLAEELGISLEQCKKIYIPDNMFIWATMNSADQGVFPLDTAFKRRWNFKYIGIDEEDKDMADKKVVIGKNEIIWNDLRKAINNKLIELNINEDKLLGPYFLSKNIIGPKEEKNIDAKKFVEAFKDKVLMYLFEDVAKQKDKSNIFEISGDEKITYSLTCKEFDKKGIDIFCEDIKNKILKKNDEEDK